MISTKDKVSIYIHWPFCKSKCPYCDFNSHVTDSVDHELWLASYIRELNHYKDYLKHKKILSIFFGGGTPSLAHESVIGGLIDYIASNFNLETNAEITMEANPTSVEAAKFKYVASYGVNRLSLGIQSLGDENLKFLGREHSAIEARHAIELAGAHFKKYSFDLIYALPNQSINDWETELNDAIKLAGGHLSLYQLTIEKGTKFFDAHRKGKFIMPEAALAADMYMATEEITHKNGYYNYEISNYAFSNHESLHNLQYWRYGDYLGIGPGAHGRININDDRLCTQNISSPNAWLSAVAGVGNGLQRFETLSDDDINIEKVMMGLRTCEGIIIYDNLNTERVTTLVDAGLLKLVNNNLVATLQGRLLLNSVIAHIL